MEPTRPAPAVSVVVSSYNQAQFLGECISSILNQQGLDDFEIVLVDDASTDHTPEVVARFSDDRVQFVRHGSNTGLVSTLNDGLAQARGRFIARIDGDDRYRPYFFAEAARILDETPEVDLVYGDVAAIDERGRTLADPWPGIPSREAHMGRRHQGNEFLALIEENFIPAPTVMARREAWAEALPIPGWVFHAFPATDWLLNLRMARARQFCYLPLSLADYRLHAANWHRKVGADPRVERTVLQILDQIFAERDYADAKRQMRGRVYSRAYLRCAAAYSAAGQSRDARRCYGRAVRYWPGCLRSAAVLRAILASVVGPRRYESWKHMYRRVVAGRSLVP